MLISRATVNNDFLRSHLRMRLRLYARFSLLCSVLLLAASVITPQRAVAQSVLGVGDDALVLPRGIFRLDIKSQWTTFNQQYGDGTPGHPTGTLEPLGTNLTVDSLGPTEFPALSPLQSNLRTLLGNSGLGVSLGGTFVSQRDQITVVPVTAQFGVSHRLMFSVTIPVVKVHSGIAFSANPKTNGNVSVNPALQSSSALNADTAFANQMMRAATAVQSYCAGAGSGTSTCTSSGGVAATALAFAQGLLQIYPTSQFVPVVGSDIQTTIDTRSASYTTTLNAFANITGSGVTAIDATGVVGAAPLTTSDAQILMLDKSYGIAADSIASIDRLHFGDIELGAKYLLFDSFHDDTKARMEPHGLNARFAVGGMLRLPTGSPDSPNNFVDLETGTHDWGIGAEGYLDLLFGGHLWTSFVARYVDQLGDDRTMRVPTVVDQVIIPIDRTTTVHRQLGNILEFEATPRWVINDFFSISAQYVYRHKPIDQYTLAPGASTGDSTTTITPSDVALLNVGTAVTEQRVGGGLSFSNFHAVEEGHAKVPFEVNYEHLQTVKGEDGNVPQAFSDQIQIRLYLRILGR